MVGATQLWSQVNPAEALAQGRAAIAEQKFAEAAATLTGGLNAAKQIGDDEQRAQAFGALHFYSAVALTGADRADAAREQLKQFFVAMPNVRSVDPKKYDAKFVKLFNDVAADVIGSNDGSFDVVYPGFARFLGKSPEATKGLWDQSPEFVLLASREEKRAWSSAASTEERAKFVEEFWERRDATPGDGRNEFREEFLARAAFADAMFTTERDRGALSGRGRVFILLGKPGSVKERRPNASDGVMSPGTSNNLHRGKGEIETWSYLVDQLPAPVPGTRISFQFATQQYHGDHILNSESKSDRALAAAAEASIRRK